MDLYAAMPYRILDLVAKAKSRSKSRTRSKTRSKSLCKRGYVKRRGYTTKKGTRVKSSCVPAKGLAKKTGGKKHGKRLGVKLRRGELKAFGYSLQKGAEKRHKALARAIKEYGATSVERKIVFLRTLRKNAVSEDQKRQHARLNVDVKWIQKKYMK